MAWIESHQALVNHPKVLALATHMGWSVDETLGRLHRFWWWCLDYAPDGIVSRQSADIIGQGIGLMHGSQFFDALLDIGWLDRRKNCVCVHDWLEYAGRYLRDNRFRRNPEKYKKIQRFYASRVSRQSAPHSQPTVSRQSAVPNQPNLTYLTNQPKDRDRRPPTKRSGYKTVMPEGWAYNGKHQALAEQLGVNVQVEFVKFRDDRLSKAVKYANWDLAFMTWLRNTQQFNRR